MDTLLPWQTSSLKGLSYVIQECRKGYNPFSTLQLCSEQNTDADFPDLTAPKRTSHGV